MKIILTDKNKQNFKTKVTHKHQYYIETLYFVGKVLQIDYEIPAPLRNEEEYRKKLKEVNIEADIEGRPKHFYSIYRKMKEQNKEIQNSIN